MVSLVESVVLVAGAVHVFVAPYSKVEESFSLHAIHDILALGIAPSQLNSYDHVEFPGAVPRSFVGPLVLSLVSYPLLAIANVAGFLTSGLSAQIIIRLTLAVLSCASIIFVARRVKVSFGKPTANTFLLLTASQFHVMFYASRTLPNMFAFPLVQVALAMIVSPWTPRTRKGKGSVVEVLEAFAVLTLAAVVMRLEILAFLIPFAVESLARGEVKRDELVLVGAAAGVASLALTVGVDSYFWQTWVWPEGFSAFYNVIEGHSTEWGVSPWDFYFTSSLPKLLSFALPLAFFSMLIDRRARRLGYPSIAFIGLLSLLEHKEWRFIVYAIPPLNICAASGIESLKVVYSKRAKNLVLFAVIATNVLLTSLTLYASVNNYPGGQALAELERLYPSFSGPQLVHIDSPSAMTGASNFLRPFSPSSSSPWFLPPSSPDPSPPLWTYSKSETLSSPEEFHSFDILVTGTPELHQEAFEVVSAVEGFERYRVKEGGWREGVEVVMKEKVWVMRRKGGV